MLRMTIQSFGGTGICSVELKRVYPWTCCLPKRAVFNDSVPQTWFCIECQYRPRAVVVILARCTLLWCFHLWCACIPPQPRLGLSCSQHAYLDQALWMLNNLQGLQQLLRTRSLAHFKDSWQSEMPEGEHSGYLGTSYTRPQPFVLGRHGKQDAGLRWTFAVTLYIHLCDSAIPYSICSLLGRLRRALVTPELHCANQTFLSLPCISIGGSYNLWKVSSGLCLGHWLCTKEGQGGTIFWISYRSEVGLG